MRLFVLRLISKFKRAFRFAVIGWHDHDWDYTRMYGMLWFKLDRMHAEMLRSESGDNRVKSVRLAARLAKRLSEEAYEDIIGELHDAKWGEMQYRFEPVEGGNSKLITWREGANTKRKQAQERKEYRAAMDRALSWRQRDLKTLTDILLKYDRSWWT